MMTSQNFSLDLLKQYAAPPDPWEPGEELFWDDPHISQSMLAAHLDPSHDAASRRPAIIDRTVAWLAAALDLEWGDSVLDLGCGPGLYTERLAERGLNVTGVDYSRRSIEYATDSAREKGLPITYRHQDYRELDDTDQYDAALLIYGDFNVLRPRDRDVVLANVLRALKPGGHFVLDVTTRILRHRHGARNRWEYVEAGFWRPGPHLVLEHGFDYPEHDLYCDQYVIIEPDGAITVYRNWFRDYSLGAISAVLDEAGFVLRGYYSDLMGTPYNPGTEWLGLIAQVKDAIDAEA